MTDRSLRTRIALQAALVLAAASSSALAQDIPLYRAEVINTYPHDSNAFTQGLTVAEGRLYEGTGRNGQSSLRLVDLESGDILRRHNLSPRYFGEGITVMDGKVYQLTWQSHVGFVYALEDFSTLGTFYLPGEGWGLTHDGESLIVSDGTPFLRFLDPATFEETRRVEVSDDRGPLARLNELEYIDGEVWANVWYEDYIARIDPASGQVTGRVDLRGLYPRRGNDDVLNGIAWDADSRRLFVTGKLWPSLFEIRVNE